MPVLRLTKLQAEMLHDRLTLPECIVEALTDGTDRTDRAEIEKVANALEKIMRIIAEKSGFGSYVTFETELEMEVLAEALEGGTYLCRMEDAYNDGDITAAEWRKYRRAADDLAEKMRKAGIETTGMLL
jgi:chaperonin GroEL (HSP60 family)